jgi:phosphoribosylamine--glycine ligase
LLPSQDHKQLLDGDRGPNTGGMGAFCPAEFVTENVMGQITQFVLEPTIAALRKENIPYRGVLYAGLMLTDTGPKVLEFNCRFGDPEAQATLPLLRGDLTEIMVSVARGEFDPSMVRAHDGAALCVVLASRGYPGPYEKGKAVSGLEDARSLPGVTVFHAGTAVRDGAVVSAGGRVLGVTGVGRDLRAAVDRAYGGVRVVGFEGAHYRTDIGHRALERVRPR